MIRAGDSSSGETKALKNFLNKEQNQKFILEA
jgi:hypothetical protein